MPWVGPSAETEIAVRISIAPESTAQVQPGQEVEAAPFRARSVRESTIELVGPLFLPRQCQLLLSWLTADDRSESLVGKGSRQEVQAVVRKVQMIDGAPDYVLWVQVDQASAHVLGDLARRLES